MSVALEYTDELVEKIVATTFDEDEWRSRGRELAKSDTQGQWKIGDWLVAGIEKLTARKAYTEALRFFTGYQRPALKNLAWVAKSVQPSLRNDSLSWAHHAAVAPYNKEIQKQLLDAAAKNDWTLKQLRKFINENDPKIVNKPKIETISVPFDHDILLKIRAWAKQCGLSEEQLVRNIIADWIQKYHRGEVGEDHSEIWE